MTRRSTNLALLFVIAVFTTILSVAQTQSSSEVAVLSFDTQLQFVGQEPYDVNGSRGTRYKLSITNRATHPDFLWKPTGKPCGKNENSSRTWVEVFGSPGDKRLAGFCGLRSSEDLGHLWFPVLSGEKGPQCVYIVMTDRQTGKKYESNRTCSRSFTVVRGRLSAGGQQQSPEGDQGWIEITSYQTVGKAENNSGDKPATYFHPLPRPVRILETRPASSEPTNKLKGNTTNNSVTREQMAAFIMRALGEPNPPPPASQRFADVPPSNPFYAFIDRAVELRIIQGCGRRRYCPDEPVAREQMAAFIIRSIGEFNPPAPAAQRFMDVPPSSPFYAFIELAASRKLLAGCAGDNFCPDRAVTRDETHEALRKTFSPTSKSADVPDRSSGKPTARVRGAAGQDSIFNSASGSTIREPDSGGPPNKSAKVVQPDLRIKQFLFPPTNDKALRVHVVNTGQVPAAACRLVLTVRKINGVAAGRKSHVNVPALSAGADDWLHIDARSILPSNVSLQATTFKVNVDATEIVAESNESNNEVWHGLPATAAIGQAIGGYANDGDEEAASEAEATDIQKLSTEPREQSKLSCRNVSARWQVCGSVSRTRFVAGVGIRFNQLDPNGKRIASRSYEHCSELAADQTLPADIRTQAAGPCKQVLQLATKEVTVQ